MKCVVAAAAVLPVLAHAFVIPDTAGEEQVQAPLAPHPGHLGHDEPHHHDHDGGWLAGGWPSKDSLAAHFEDTLDSLAENIESVVDSVHDWVQATADGVADGLGGGDHSFPDATLYQLISESKYTTKFAKLVDEHPNVVKLLNSTTGDNHTVFVPVDEAFEHIPKGHKPDAEFVEKVLLYHIGLGNYPAKRILGTHTLPTALNSSFLGGDAQRLRTRVGLGGLTVNFYSKVIAADIEAKNGIIHGVRSIIVPPPMVGKELSLFPDKFSTLLLAFEKTNFVKYIHGVKMIGSTVFAPSNNAFSRLGPRANAFLFNSETGLKYLNAILKYHIAPNATLYSDAFYDKTSSNEVSAETEHFDLTTLLNDVHVGVDIGKFFGFVTMRVNGFSHVVVEDGVALNGVIQVLDKVLIPPHKHKHGEDAFATDEISVEELKERLQDYVE